MTAARAITLIVLGIILGGAVGAGLGMAGGLAYTTLAHTSNFEGQSGYVVAFWMLLGIILGALAGPFIALKLGRRMSRPNS